MEVIPFKKVIEQVEENKKVALVTVIEESGISPAKKGLSMAVVEDKSIFGTIGGGSVEYEVARVAFEQLEKEESINYCYKSENAKVDVFIKVFNTTEKLLIIGAGHVARELYKIANIQNFYTVIFDDREKLLNRENFPQADEIYIGDTIGRLKQYKIDENCYIVVCGATHIKDQMAIEACIDRGAKYLGMLGSRKKIKEIKENLANKGISQKSLDEIYAPIGINTGGDSVSEIAFGIFGEVLAIKNNCEINHMKDIKK